jgi:hypothetical protein
LKKEGAMGNDGLPISIAIIIAVVILGALGFVGWIVSSILTNAVATPTG